LTLPAKVDSNSNTTNTINMANESVIDRTFTAAFNELDKYYENDELDTCVEKSPELLQSSAIPK
jgi:hypothetical protein